MFGEIGIEKLILLFVVVLVMFGAKRLPEIGQGLGKGIREFKRATTGSLDEPSAGVLGAERGPVAEPREAPSFDEGGDDGPRRLMS
jgi:sec-independent protein translocase protein TatA